MIPIILAALKLYIIFLLFTLLFVSAVVFIRRQTEELGRYQELMDQAFYSRFFKVLKANIYLSLPLTFYIILFLVKDPSNLHSIWYIISILCISVLVSIRILANMPIPPISLSNDPDFALKNKEKSLTFLQDFMIAAYLLLLLHFFINVAIDPFFEVPLIAIRVHYEAIFMTIVYFFILIIGTFSGEIVLRILNSFDEIEERK